MADNVLGAPGEAGDPSFRTTERDGQQHPHLIEDGYAKPKITKVTVTTTAAAAPTTALANRCRMDIQNRGTVPIQVLTETGDTAWGNGWVIDVNGEKSFPVSAGGVLKLVTETVSNTAVVLCEYAPV